MRKGSVLLMVVLLVLAGGPLLADVLFQDNFTGTTGDNISKLAQWSDACMSAAFTRTIDNNMAKFDGDGSASWNYTNIRADAIEGVAKSFNPITPTGCRFESTVVNIVNPASTDAYAGMYNIGLSPLSSATVPVWNMLGERINLYMEWKKPSNQALLTLRFEVNTTGSANAGYTAYTATPTVNFAAGERIRLAVEVRDDAGKSDVRMAYQIYSSGSWGAWNTSPWYDPTNATYGSNAFAADWKARWYGNTYYYLEAITYATKPRTVWIDDVTVTGTADTAPTLGPITFQSDFTGTDGAAISSLPQWADACTQAGTTKTLDTNQAKITTNGGGWLYSSVEAYQAFNPLTSACGRFESQVVKISDASANTTLNGSLYMYLADRDGWTGAGSGTLGEKILMSAEVLTKSPGTAAISLAFINHKDNITEWHSQLNVDVGRVVWTQTIALGLGTADHVKLAVEFRDSPDNKTVRGGFSFYTSATGTWSDWVYSTWYDPIAIASTVNPGNPAQVNINAFDADWKTRWINTFLYIEGYAPNGRIATILVDDVSVKSPIGDKGSPDFGAVTFQSDFTGTDGTNIGSLPEWYTACATAGTTRTLESNQGKFGFNGSGWVFSSIEANPIFNPVTATGGHFEATCLKIDNTTATSTTYAYCSLNVTDRDGWASGSYYETGEKVRMYAYIADQASGAVDLNLSVVNRKENGEWHQYNSDSGVDVWHTRVYINLRGGDHAKLAVEFRDSSDNKTLRGGYSIYNAAAGTWGKWIYSSWVDPMTAPDTINPDNTSQINVNAFDADWRTRWTKSYLYLEAYANNGSAPVVMVDDVLAKAPLVDAGGPPLGPVTFQSDFTGTDGDNISSLAQWADANGGTGMTKTLQGNQGQLTTDGSNWLYPSIRATQIFNPLTATGARFESQVVQIADNSSYNTSNGSVSLILSDRSAGWSAASCYVPGEKVRMMADVLTKNPGSVALSLSFGNNKGTSEWHAQTNVDVGAIVWTRTVSLNIGTVDHVKLAIEFRDSADNKTVRGGYSLYSVANGTWGKWTYSDWFDPTAIAPTVNPSNPEQMDIHAFDADWKNRWIGTSMYLEGYAPKLRVDTILVDDAVVKCPIGEIAMNRPYTIDYSDNITVDGFLDDWATATWTPLDQPYDRNPWDLSSAEYAVKWGAGGTKIYAAVRVHDLDHILSDNYSGEYAVDNRDAVEFYLHTTGVSSDGSYAYAEAAQQLTVGVKKSDPYAVWTSLPPMALGAPTSYDYQAYGYQDGEWYYYEVAMTPYQYFGGVVSQPNVLSVLSTNQVIGFDVTVPSADTNYMYIGMKSENLMRGKYHDYTKIGLHKLVGTAPAAGDVNDDGHVDAVDLGLVLAAMDTASTGPVDVDHDGQVTSSDMSIVLANME